MSGRPQSFGKQSRKFQRWIMHMCKRWETEFYVTSPVKNMLSLCQKYPIKNLKIDFKTGVWSAHGSVLMLFQRSRFAFNSPWRLGCLSVCTAWGVKVGYKNALWCFLRASSCSLCWGAGKCGFKVPLKVTTMSSSQLSMIWFIKRIRAAEIWLASSACFKNTSGLWWDSLVKLILISLLQSNMVQWWPQWVAHPSEDKKSETRSTTLEILANSWVFLCLDWSMAVFLCRWKLSMTNVTCGKL